MGIFIALTHAHERVYYMRVIISVSTGYPRISDLPRLRHVYAKKVQGDRTEQKLSYSLSRSCFFVPLLPTTTTVHHF